MKRAIVHWATAIQIYEGWAPGSRSYRNNNPGNLRGGMWPLVEGRDKDGFLIFRDYRAGFDALCTLLERAATGKSRIYCVDDTLLKFFERYAPASDGNHPGRYATFVARRLGVPADTPIGTLI